MIRRGALLLLLVLVPTALRAQAETQEVFARFRERVVQVRVLDEAGGEKSAIGSGFLVGSDGLVVTNFHVVSMLVNEPEHYRGECVAADNVSSAFEILNVDVVHDLALLRSKLTDRPYFAVAAFEPTQGTRVYSMGNPRDLGLTIVEGTYNGLLEQSLYEKIHFTGSVNPGMSGGPAFTEDGTLVGVNVATAGNQMSFLVPEKYVRALLTAVDAEPGHDLMATLRTQLLANQNLYIDSILAKPLVTTGLEGHRVPGKIAPFFKCWSNSVRKKENPYEVIYQTCRTEDDIYLSGTLESGSIQYSHQLVRTSDLNRFRFASLQEKMFENQDWFRGEKADLTPFRCSTDFVDLSGTTFKGVVCLRAYKKLPGLFDAVVRAASIASDNEAIQTRLILLGVSAPNAARFVRAYLEGFAWTD